MLQKSGYVTVPSIDDFQVLQLLNDAGDYQTSVVTDAHGGEFLLTVFSPKMSARTTFRAAFRSESSLLLNVSHPHLCSMIGTGESEGKLYFVSELPAGITLEMCLQSARVLLWEDVAEIGWQLSSALQSIHNLGISHGGLQLTTVMLDEDLKCEIISPGIERWIRESEPLVDVSDANAKEVAADLQALGRILRQMVQNISEKQPGGDVQQAVLKLCEDLDATTGEAFPTAARDVQGRLGDFLLDVSGDEIDMLDHRERSGLGRRSIVDELFEEEPASSGHAANQRNLLNTWRWGGILLVVVLLLYLVARCAGLNFSY